MVMIDVLVPKEVEDALAQKGISADMCKRLVYDAEDKKTKLVNKVTGENLTKKIMDNITLYVIYASAAPGTQPVTAYVIKKVYSHKMRMKNLVYTMPEEVKDWWCAKDNCPTVRGQYDLEYMGIVRMAPTLTCPKCQDSYIEEDIAAKPVAVAETLFEKKRA
ncbi:MAG: DUF7479 domain-containing protein [Nitrososphaerales archaeon]